MAIKNFKVKKHHVTGELSGEAKTSEDIVDELCSLLDGACSWDIVGPALIEDTKGNFYKVVVEAHIVPVTKAEAKEAIKEDGEDEDNED